MLTSDATVAIASRDNQMPDGLPQISVVTDNGTDGTLTVPNVLSVDTSDISDDDNPANTEITFTYQWHRGSATDFAYSSSTAIASATGNTYTLTDDDAGQHLLVVVSFTDGRTNNEVVESSTIGPIVQRPNRDATGTPSITNADGDTDGFIVPETLIAGQGSIADVDGLPNLSEDASYQWQRSVASSGPSANPTDISGATGNTYKLTDDDAEQYIRVVVSFNDAREFPEEVESAYTSQIVQRPNRDATGTPSITGTASVLSETDSRHRWHR